MAFSSASRSLLLVVVVCLCSTVFPVLAVPTCARGPGMSWLADPDDCSKFYVCHGTRRFAFDCGQHVWDPATKTCVGKGSQWDTCTIAKELDSLNDMADSDTCANSNSAVFAKADNCAQYYDCSSGEATVTQDPHVVECKYPQLFNEDTKRCDDFDKVKCGLRHEPVDACEYVANQCRRSHCIPCNVRFPSCKGLPDGLNPWIGREMSPYFVLCQQQRPLYHGQCDNSKGTQIFDPEKRVCVEMKVEKVG